MMLQYILFFNVEKSTFLVYAFNRGGGGGGEGVAKKSTLCTLVKTVENCERPLTHNQVSLLKNYFKLSCNIPIFNRAF